jgi:hypothetical protein
MFSSVNDLSRFAVAFLSEGRLDDRHVLSAAAVASLGTRKTDSIGGCGYTYGLADCAVRGVRTLSHYGFRSGSGSIVRFIPSRRAAVILLANRNGGILARTENAVLRMLLPAAPPAAGTSEDPPLRVARAEEIARLSGRYANGSDVLTLRATESGFVYRYGSEAELPVRLGGANEIIVTSQDGQPVQRFVVVVGKVTGDLYLSDGTAAFRRQKS